MSSLFLLNNCFPISFFKTNVTYHILHYYIKINVYDYFIKIKLVPLNNYFNYCYIASHIIYWCLKWTSRIIYTYLIKMKLFLSMIFFFLTNATFHMKINVYNNVEVVSLFLLNTRFPRWSAF